MQSLIIFLVFLVGSIVLNRKINTLKKEIDALEKWIENTASPDIISLSDTVQALLSYQNLEVYEFVGEDGVKYTLLEQDDGSEVREED